MNDIRCEFTWVGSTAHAQAAHALATEFFMQILIPPLHSKMVQF